MPDWQIFLPVPADLPTLRQNLYCRQPSPHKPNQYYINSSNDQYRMVRYGSHLQSMLPSHRSLLQFSNETLLCLFLCLCSPHLDIPSSDWPRWSHEEDLHILYLHIPFVRKTIPSTLSPVSQLTSILNSTHFLQNHTEKKVHLQEQTLWPSGDASHF